jgi:peroxiredoxin
MRGALNTGVLLSLVSLKASAQIPRPLPEPTIPHFQFFKLDNASFTDNDLPKGKMIFFMFLDPDCDHCQHAIKTIGEQYQAFKKTAVLLISLGEKSKINHFMDTYGSKLKGEKNVTVLEDKLQQFITKFNPVRYPSMFLYSAERKLLDYEDNPESVFRLVNTINRSIK